MDLRSQRGMTLLEAMLAMTLLLIGALGLFGLHTQHLKMNADARRTTTAVALARDLVENIAMWRWDDARLVNTTTDNDADIGDDAGTFQTETFSFDYDDDDLGTWNGLALPPGFERYWNVAYVDDIDANGIPDAVRVGVIVRWRSDAGWRKVVLMTSKANPAESL